MLLSMTGYGRSRLPINGKTYTVEVRALNSKGLDINVRLSNMFREREMDIRNLVSGLVIRGKVDILINNDPGEEQRSADLDPALISAYVQRLREAAGTILVSDEKLFELAAQMPNVAGQTQETLLPEQWNTVAKALQDACAELTVFRKQEGSNLQKDLELRTRNIEDTLLAVEQLDPERRDRSKDKLMQQLNSQFSDEQIDKNRFEQELIYYLEKMDITEEIIRLRSHCTYFLENITQEAIEKGKKLAFISQEMGREINTIGAKSYHAGMQKLVVDMKDELEKIKEQLNNVL